MKKIYICALAAMAITMASCGNKTTANQEGTDSAMVANDTTAMAGMTAADAQGDAETLNNNLKAMIEAKDAKGIQAITAQAKEKIQQLINSGNYEAAKAYAEKVKTFINENAETVKSIAGGNETINSLVNTITNIPANAEGAANNAKEAAQNAGNAVKSSAQDAVNNAGQKIEDKVNEKKAEAKKKATEAVDKKKEEANKAVNDAVNKGLNKLRPIA